MSVYESTRECVNAGVCESKCECVGVSECECAGVFVLCAIVCINVCETVWKTLCVCDCE